MRKGPAAGEIAGIVRDWKTIYEQHSTREIDLVSDFYRFLRLLEVPRILDPDRPYDSNLMGALARFSTILADYEHVTRHGRYIEENGSRVFRAGTDRGKGYLFGLWNYLYHYAFSAYEDFEGEAGLGTDAVQVLTVHQAKGLEWPVMFLPSLVEGRFPSRWAGVEQEWPFPEQVFPR